MRSIPASGQSKFWKYFQYRTYSKTTFGSIWIMDILTGLYFQCILILKCGRSFFRYSFSTSRPTMYVMIERMRKVNLENLSNFHNNLFIVMLELRHERNERSSHHSNKINIYMLPHLSSMTSRTNVSVISVKRSLAKI